MWAPLTSMTSKRSPVHDPDINRVKLITLYLVAFVGLFAYIDVFCKGIYDDGEVLQSLRTQHILREKIGQILRIRSDENRREIQTPPADQKAQDSTLYGDDLDLVGNRHPRREHKIGD